MNSCLFCNPEYRKSASYFENEYFFVIFDIHPVSPGHSVIISKRHILNFLDLTTNEWQELQLTIRKTIDTIEKTDLKKIYEEIKQKQITQNSILFCDYALKHSRINKKPDAYNHGLNDGRAAGRTVDHLHWHVIPRYENDVADPTGGVRFVIPELGNYKISK